MDVKADYSKITQGSDSAPGITYLKGNVQVNQGSMKAHGAEATMYQHPANAKDAQGNDISGSVQRVVLTGKQAHMEQKQDSDGGLMTADADKIDYNSDTSVMVLTGGVTVVQAGRGEFHGTQMTYNTNTGEMESGDNTPANRVHMIIQPKAKPAASGSPAANPAGATATPAAPPGKAGGGSR